MTIQRASLNAFYVLLIFLASIVAYDGFRYAKRAYDNTVIKRVVNIMGDAGMICPKPEPAGGMT